jgi:hypothetical protein
MTEPTNIVPDPFDELLGARAAGEGHEALHQRLLERTTRALRRRRSLRVLAWSAALVVGYAAGVLTMFWFTPKRVEFVKAAEPPPPAPASESAPLTVAPPASAVALEWKAFDDQRPDLYRQAADRYLHEGGDPASAIRCYGQSLNGASDKDLAILPDDDYLLMIVKEARQRESNDAKRHN